MSIETTRTAWEDVELCELSELSGSEYRVSTRVTPGVKSDRRCRVNLSRTNGLSGHAISFELRDIPLIIRLLQEMQKELKVKED